MKIILFWFKSLKNKYKLYKLRKKDPFIYK